VSGLRDSTGGKADIRLGDLDQAAATRTALADLSADLPGRAVLGSPPQVVVGPTPGTVTVTVTRDIPHIFGKALPGAPDAERITVSLSGHLRQPPP
jgi:hypothetical protein